MKRIVVIGTALAVLVGATAAYAAYNNYAGTTTTISKGVGSKKKPVRLSMVQTLKAGAPTGERAAPLTSIKTTLYGVKLDAGKLPVCTDAKILQNKASPTGACPKGSLIGEVLSYPKTVNGKAYMVGVGCKNHKRPWTATFTAHKYGGGSETQTVSGATHC